MENRTSTAQNEHMRNKIAIDAEGEAPVYTPNLDYDFFRANSVTDCTGTVPRPPQTDDELDSYLDVYNFLPQCAIAQDRADS